MCQPHLYFNAGVPAINMLVWIVLRLLLHDGNDTKVLMRKCPFFDKTVIDYIYEIPACIILICNLFFLFWIIMVCHLGKYDLFEKSIIKVVISKLRHQNVPEHDHRHLKAVKVIYNKMKDNSFYNLKVPFINSILKKRGFGNLTEDFTSFCNLS